MALRARGEAPRNHSVFYLASLLYALGHFEELSSQAPAQFEQIADPALRGQAWIWLLEAFAQRRDLARALPLMERFREVRDERMRPYDLQQYEVLQSLMFALVGALDRSAEIWIAAEQKRKTLGAALDPTQVQCARMDWLLVCEQYDEAAHEAQEVLGRTTVAPEERSRAQLGLAIAHARRGRNADAREALRPLEQQQDAFGRRARGELARLALQRGDHDEARAWLDTREYTDALDDPQLVPLAWLVVGEVERGASPSVPLAELEDRLRAHYAALLAAWDFLPPEASGHAFLQLGIRRDLLSALCAVVLSRLPGERGAEVCLDLLLEAEARGSTARSLALPVRRLREIRERLVPAGRVVLVYLPALTASWCFALTAREVIGVRLPSDRELRTTSRDLNQLLHEQVAELPDDAWARLSNAALAWCLPERLRDFVQRAEELAIVGGELLQPLHLGALPWNGTYLGCAKPLFDLPSLTLGAHYQLREPVSRELDLAVLAATRIDARDAEAFGVSALPMDDGEAREIAAGLSEDRVAIVSAAGADDLRNGAGAAAKVTVCIAHGVTVATPQMRDLIVLGRSDPDRPGALGPKDLANAPDLLLLFACHSASAQLRRGEDGGQRLVGRFLFHGSQAVVAADGPLELGAALHLARALVRELTNGESAAEALRRAKVELLAQPRWRHPRFHAHLRLVGDGSARTAMQVAAPATGTLRNPWLIAGAILLLCAGIFGWRWSAQRK
ncbi:MAG: CHAT domain-containing protein [Planctomycetes bacterium]|nr:CHAT domain-containing protein [Planctomycetota bacterium]